MNDIAVVSAIIGGYDEVKSIPSIEGVDYFLFTDQDKDIPEPWTGLLVNKEDQHPRSQAKKYKLLTHKFFPYYTTLVWLDGSVAIKSDSALFDIIQYAKYGNLWQFKHPARDCLYEEAQFSLTLPKYQEVSRGIRKQISDYYWDGFPAHYGLWASGIIVRNNIRQINNMFELWAHHCAAYSYQDQVSQPYVCWQTGVSPQVFDKNLWGNDWFELQGHNSEL